MVQLVNTQGIYPQGQLVQDIMVRAVPTITVGKTIADVEEMLRTKGGNFEVMTYIYIVDEAGQLRGVLSIKELFRSPATMIVDTLIPAHVVAIKETMDQEEVVRLALQYGLKALPVVNEEGILVGAVPSRVILRVLEQEATEDVLRFGGIFHRDGHGDMLNISLLMGLKQRLPWLLLGLVGGLLVSGLIHQFEEVLAQHVMLAAFIPLIVYMADAVGTQMQAYIIRDLAMYPGLSFPKYVWKQSGVIFFITIIIALLVYGGTLVLYGNGALSGILAISLVIAMLSSIITGLLIPYGFSRAHFDPANASGPIATIIQDTLSVFIYFSVASALLKFL